MKNFLKSDLSKFKVVDGDYRMKATYTDNFILYRGSDFIEIILDEKFLNQKVKIILNNEMIFNDVLHDISLFISINQNKLYDLDMIAKGLIIVNDNNY